MKEIFVKPKIGRIVTYTTDYHLPTPTNVRTSTGTVIESESWDDPSAFRSFTGDERYPVSIVSRKYVTDLRYDDGTILGKEELKPDIEQFQIVNSKGDGFYTVTVAKGDWTCTCAGYGFRRHCRHIEEAQK